MSATWTREAVEALGPTTNVKTARSILGIGERLAYESIKRGEWPTRVLRFGTQIRIPTRDLLALLFSPDISEAGPATGPALDNASSKDATDGNPTAPTSPLRAVRSGA